MSAASPVGGVQTISSQACIYAFAAGNQASYWVHPDEIVRVSMRDALDGQVRDEPAREGPAAPTLPALVIDQARANPATGPIGVVGALPGQALAVDILDLRVAPRGYVTYGARPRFFDQGVGGVVFNSQIRLPLCPMIGTIGVAPREGAFPNGLAGDHGGNMDVKDVCAGATIYLPVAQEGALLALGDVHSVMADGESSGQGVETEAEATIRLRLLQEPMAPLPVILRDGRLITVAAGETLDRAAKRAVEAMARLLSTYAELSYDEARILLGLLGEVRVGQMVCSTRTVRVCIPVATVPWRRSLPL